MYIYIYIEIYVYTSEKASSVKLFASAKESSIAMVHITQTNNCT